MCVTRGTRWGNPYRIIQRRGGWDIRYSLGSGADEFLQAFPDVAGARAAAVFMFEFALLDGELLYTVGTVRELAGATLACWCPVEAPCHGDVLLRVANDPLIGAYIAAGYTSRSAAAAVLRDDPRLLRHAGTHRVIPGPSAGP